MLVNPCVGITTSQHHNDQKPMELPNTQSIEKKTVLFALLVQSGHSEKCRGVAAECFCCLRNTQDKLADRKSPYEEDVKLHVMVQ